MLYVVHTAILGQADQSGCSAHKTTGLTSLLAGIFRTLTAGGSGRYMGGVY